MEVDTSRRGSFVQEVATALLFVLVIVSIVRSIIGIVLPLDYDVFAVVVAGAFLVLGIANRFSPARSGGDGTGFTERQLTIALIGLGIIGAILRVYSLGEQSFWFDEAITTNAAIGLLDHGRPEFPSGVVYRRAFPHTILVATSMAIFGATEWAARLPAAAFGVATIPVTYWLGREVGNRRVGLLAAVLVTFLTWEIAWGRQARMYQQLQFFYALTLVGLARIDRTGIDDRDTLALVAGGTVLAALTHTIGLILFPVAITYIAVDQWRGLGRMTRRGWALVGATVLVALVLELVGPGPITVTRTVLATDIVHVDRYHSWISAEFGILTSVALVGIGLSFGNRRHGFLLALAILPPLWVLAFNTRLFAARYVYFAVPIFVVYIAFTIDYVVEQTLRSVSIARANDRFSARFGRPAIEGLGRHVIGLLLPIVLVVLLASSSLTFVPQAEYALGPNAPQPDFKAAYAYVDSHAHPDDVLVAGWTAPALYYHGSVDYWVRHNLTGAERNWTIDAGYEVYSGAIPITNAAAFRAVIDCQPRGWIVVDRIVYQRMRPEVFDVIDELDFHEAGANGIRVYSWKGGGECASEGGETLNPGVTSTSSQAHSPVRPTRGLAYNLPHLTGDRSK